MKKVRCAIYTRKSSEEGLQLQFNSLHAQREACEAYVLSQAGEGWTALSTHYDDGGISGAHVDRPGLQAMLADITSGKIDVIVVYKVDRLTRSLADFAKLVDVFDEHDVSFVSVTQAFNTTNSMGRLTLNVLLSFAQFEREVTAERIRDKIALSRKRGLWTGGLPPLGYDIVDKKLIVNDMEAQTVRHIFERYRTLETVRLLKAELDGDGYLSKRRVNKHGKVTGHQPFGRGALYNLLQNKTYLGLTPHKGKVYDGQHEAIVDRSLFDEVQAILAENRRRDKHKVGARHPSLLTGKLFTSVNNRMVPSHAQTHGRRYRYYVEKAQSGSLGPVTKPLTRLPAAEIEASVKTRIANYVKSNVFMDDLGLAHLPHDGQVALRSKAVLSLGEEGTLKDVVDQVCLHKDLSGYDLTLNLTRLTGILELEATDDLPNKTITVPMDIRTCNKGKKIIVSHNPDRAPNPNPILIKALIQAHRIKLDYVTSDPKPIPEIARNMNMNQRQVRRLLKLAYLAPDIQLAILNGEQAPDLTLRHLTNMSLPSLWDDQRHLLAS